MKVAIPTFGDRVSPRFDCAGTFLVVTFEQGAITQRQEISAANWAPHERINRLIDLGVTVVVCGGIDRWSADSLLSVGVTLHGWISGSIEESLEALQCGELQSDASCVGDARCGRGRTARYGRRRGGRPQPPGP